MEVKPGCKQTEVGVIPEDWVVRRVAGLVRHGPKNGYSGRSGSDANGTPTLTLSATTSGKLILNQETVKYLEERIASASDLFLSDEDVLVQRSNTIELVGTTAIFTGPSDTYIYPDLMMRLRFRDRISAEWFWRYANSSAGRNYFMRIAAGSTGSMPKLSGAHLREMPIPLPPTKAEQEAIAGALSDADALIDALEQLVAKKRQIKQGAMQELLTGQKRLPGFATSAGYKQTEVGVIPEDWEVRRVGELVKHGPKNGYSGRSGNDPFGTPTLSLSATTSGRLVLNQETVKYLEIRILPESDLFLRCDDVLAQRSNTLELVGTTAIFIGPGNTYIYPDLMMRLRFRDRISALWFWRYANSSAGRGYFMSVAAGSTGTMQKVSGDKLRDMPIPLPLTKAEQEAIAALLSDMDSEIAALEAKLTKARQLKQGMMQELLTGQVRLV